MTLILIMIARRSVACGHRSLHPAQPNSTAQETQAFLRALELRPSAALCAIAAAMGFRRIGDSNYLDALASI